MSDRAPREDGPTEVVETDSGELVERLSAGTATLLLAWLIGIGALSTLLGAWAYVWVVSGQRLGLGALFGGFGIYTAVAGSAGPCVLWLAGRAQGHTLGWFLATSAKIALVMVGIVLAFLLLILLVMGGRIPVAGGLAAAGVMVAVALVLSVIWGVATWAADRWIARARVEA
ncbi:MAG: hypothetical protein IT341_09725 [Chloroflexi bacterium]|nr:hypothetical protein [Chloroflexota bacterium]